MPTTLPRSSGRIGVIERYADFLPLTSATPRINLGEGSTPLVRSNHIGPSLGIDQLYFKLEMTNPSGSFKDRGMVVAVAKAIEEQFVDKLSRSKASEEQAILKDFAGQLGDLEQRYMELVNGQGAMLGVINGNSQKLADMFVEALASVQFQDVVRQQIDHVNHAVARLDTRNEQLAAALRTPEHAQFPEPIAKQLEEMFDGYVMAQQRQAHQRAAPTADPPSTGETALKIELF